MGELEARLADAEKERDCLQRQMAASLPQVNPKHQRAKLNSKCNTLICKSYRNWHH